MKGSGKEPMDKLAATANMNNSKTPIKTYPYNVLSLKEYEDAGLN